MHENFQGYIKKLDSGLIIKKKKAKVLNGTEKIRITSIYEMLTNINSFDPLSNSLR